MQFSNKGSLFYFYAPLKLAMACKDLGNTVPAGGVLSPTLAAAESIPSGDLAGGAMLLTAFGL